MSLRFPVIVATLAVFFAPVSGAFAQSQAVESRGEIAATGYVVSQQPTPGAESSLVGLWSGDVPIDGVVQPVQLELLENGNYRLGADLRKTIDGRQVSGVQEPGGQWRLEGQELLLTDAGQDVPTRLLFRLENGELLLSHPSHPERGARFQRIPAETVDQANSAETMADQRPDHLVGDWYARGEEGQTSIRARLCLERNGQGRISVEKYENGERVETSGASGPWSVDGDDLVIVSDGEPVRIRCDLLGENIFVDVSRFTGFALFMSRDSEGGELFYREVTGDSDNP
jgi:hypothetical protein